jgi:L-fuculose-phosphate aldolase
MYRSERQQVAAFMRRLYDRGLTTTSGGNVSCRTSGGAVALTPSGLDKAVVTWEQVAILGLDGTSLTPELKPTMETSMHLEIYRRHADVNAVVHAHPVTASVFCACGATLNTRLTAEAYVIVGEPVLLPYACMGSDALAACVAAGVGRAVCVLLENHGVLTVGRDLLQAFDRLEVLEAAARQTVLAQHLGGARELDAAQCAELDILAGRSSGRDGVEAGASREGGSA